MFENPEENRAEVDEISAYKAVVIGRNMFGPVRASGTGSGTAGGATIRCSTARSSCSPITRATRSRWRAAPSTTSSPTEPSRHWNGHAAAGDGDVAILGGANTIIQYLAAGRVDELRLHIVPITLGAGARLFDGVPPLKLEQVKSRAASAVTYLTYRMRS